MTRPPQICTAVLAAGQSRRFGKQDKLSAELQSMMLGLHICKTLSSLEFCKSVVISASADHPCAEGWRASGFEIVINPDADKGMGTSVALAAKQAQISNADALLICLADMPFVPAEHISAIISHLGSDTDGIIASHNGTAAMPPAIFGRSRLDHLAKLDGSEGARSLFKEAHQIALASEKLVDIDRPDILEALNSLSR